MTRIRPSRGWVSLKLDELWEYRELLYFLVWRDIKVRYKQTVLGAAWAILQPFMTMVVFSLFFGKLAKIPSEGVPYPIFSFAALVPWTFFATGLGQGANSLVGSQNLIKKVYFPRLVIPIASVLSGVVDFALAFLVLLGMMLFYGIVPTLNVLWLPLLLLLALVTSLGVEPLAVGPQRPVPRHPLHRALPDPVLALRHARSPTPRACCPSPGEPSTASTPWPAWSRASAGPCSAPTPGPGPMILVSTVAAVTLLVTGAFYFRRMEKTFADVV